MNNSSRQIRVGTRGSKLALAQTHLMLADLRRIYPEENFDVIIIKTEGDQDQETALEKIGGVGLFTKKIEAALLDETIDIAVHSAKDLPSVMTAGLAIGAVPMREDCRDAWLSRRGEKLADIKSGAVVGTSSPRRRAQVMYHRPDLKVMDIRGNVDTRLRKLEEGQYDAILMARAGLNRLGLEGNITETLPMNKFLPAPGQGFLLVQIRADDKTARALTEPLDRPESRRCLEIERKLLEILKAGCSAAVGGYAEIVAGRASLQAVVLDKQGRRRLYKAAETALADGNSLAKSVAADLIRQGAEELIDS